MEINIPQINAKKILYMQGNVLFIHSKTKQKKKMKKRVNKQCLLNTPRRVTVYHKNYFLNIISSCKCPMGVHHVGMISIVPSKTEVGVDRLVKALTCKKTKKNCLSSHSCYFVKIYFFAITFLQANVQ